MAALPATDEVNALEMLAGSISRITGRFGAGTRTAFATIGAGFAFPNGPVARTDALPGLLRRLVEQLSASEV
jgi:hypothetical protein